MKPGKRSILLWLLLPLLLTITASAHTAGQPQALWSRSAEVAHCLGEVDGNYYTNSKEAFLASYEKGIRVVEADFAVSSDGVLVIRHDFGAYSATALNQPELVGAITGQQHLETPILGKYTALSAESLLTLLKEYPDVWLITDTKETDVALTRQIFTLLVEAAQRVQAQSVLQRLVVQVYDMGMKEAVSQCYPFSHWILTVYQLPGNSDYAVLADYCVKQGIQAVTIPTTRLTQPLVQLFHQRGLRVFTHTLNDPAQVGWALSLGVDGIYTDVLTDLQVRQLGLAKKYPHPAELFQKMTVKLLERMG